MGALAAACAEAGGSPRRAVFGRTEVPRKSQRPELDRRNEAVSAEPNQPVAQSAEAAKIRDDVMAALKDFVLDLERVFTPLAQERQAPK